MEKKRGEWLIELRPKLPIVIDENANEAEAFMHKTLRPILKFQNDWIIRTIESAQHFQHLKFDDWDENINRNLLTSFLSKNKNVRHHLLGGISALMTSEELEFYLFHSSELNKRIVQMMVTRFVTSYFSTP